MKYTPFFTAISKSKLCKCWNLSQLSFQGYILKHDYGRFRVGGLQKGLFSAYLLQETIAWDPTERERENHRLKSAFLGVGICDRCQIRVCLLANMWKSKGKTSPTKWLPIQQQPFPGEFLGSQILNLGYLPVDGPQNASERRWFFKRFRYITVPSLWSPWLNRFLAQTVTPQKNGNVYVCEYVQIYLYIAYICIM